MENLSDFVMKVIGYLIVPAAMFAAFILLVSYDSFQLKKGPEAAGLKKEKRFPWGALAGVVLFLLYLVYAIHSYRPPRTSMLGDYGFNARGATAGIIFGFVIAVVRVFSFHIVLKDLFVMLFTPILMMIIHGYFFEREHNDVIISGVLGMLLGITLNKIVIAGEIERRTR